jgi:hypothetical protein
MPPRVKIKGRYVDLLQIDELEWKAVTKDGKEIKRLKKEDGLLGKLLILDKELGKKVKNESKRKNPAK